MSLDQLPLEIREEIYPHALEPRADFTFTTFVLPGEKEATSIRLSFPGMHSSEDETSVDGDNPPEIRAPNEEGPCHPSLMYKLSLFTPLLLTDSSICKEVQRVIHRTARHFHRMISASFRHGRFCENPPQRMLDLYKMSRLILRTNSGMSWIFLAILPDLIRESFVSIAITSHLLLSDDTPNQSLWHGSTLEEVTDHISEDEFTRFTRKLLDFHNLRSVAIWIPREDHQRDLFLSCAPLEMCNLLYTSRLDTVRFVYDEENLLEQDARRDYFMQRAIRQRGVGADCATFGDSHKMKHEFDEKPDLLTPSYEHLSIKCLDRGQWRSWPLGVKNHQTVYILRRE